jgi:dTDP-4-amino-4,6-dideoxygalactose transaminase
MPIPFLSLRDQTASLKSEILAAFEAVIDTQGFANGPAVASFERKLASYLGVRDVVCVNSGTTALHAALLAVGVKPGDDVLTVSHTWISTAWAITYCGANPLFCDIDPATCGMDPAVIERRLTPRTSAILPVHLYGHPVDLDPILEIARRRGVPVVEDAAQSIGAKYQGRHTGTFGLANATSFYPGKNLGAWGEGGALMTDSPEIAARVRRLRDHAQASRHHHVEIGHNWRMDGLQGAVLSVKLGRLDQWNSRRREIAARYRVALCGLPGLRLLPAHAWCEPIWHVFPAFHTRRDALREALERRGVATGVHYPTPVHLQPAYAHLGLGRGALPEAERAADEEVSLPMFAELSDSEVDEVIGAVASACHELARRGSSP